MRRAIILFLALCLLTGTVWAGAFSDEAAIHNGNEVGIMAGLGLVGGYEDGSFRPTNNIRRSEAAKLAALVCEETPAATKDADFSDVPKTHWAAKYIAYCAEKNIIGGAGGKFRPEDFVTAREFAKMLLGCVGYDVSSYTGARWAEAVDEDARRLDVYSGFQEDPGRYLSRDDACLLLYNAMQCYAVTGRNDSGDPVYALDDLMNPMTYMEYRFHVVKFSAVLTGNEYADLTAKGKALEPGRSKLAGHTEFAISTPYTFLGRTVELYTVRTEVGDRVYYKAIGRPSLSATDETCVVENAEDYILVLRYSGYVTGAATEYYYNGDASDEGFFSELGDDYQIVGIDRNGDKVLDAVVVWDFEQGTVTSADPLTVSVDGVTLPARFLTGGEPLEVGAAVRCLRLADAWYLP